MNDWNVIISFMYPHEAHMAKGMLEAEGFEVLIKDEMTVQVNNFYSNAIGGVKLLVKQEEAERAYTVLREAGYIKEEKKEEKEMDSFSKQYTKKCPYCESGEVIKKKSPGYVIIFSIILLGIPIPFIRRTYYCFNCQNEWRIK